MAFVILAVVSASTEGISLLMMVDFITGKVNLQNQTTLLHYIVVCLQYLSININYTNVYLTLLVLLVFRIALSYFSGILDNVMLVKLRRRIQERSFTHILHGDWEELRTMRTGYIVGIVTNEADKVTAFFINVIRAANSLIIALGLIVMAVIVSPGVTLLFGAVGVPAILILRWVFKVQIRLSEQSVIERQGFVADVTESINSLFHIKVEGKTHSHINKGLTHIPRYYRLEMLMGYPRAFINSFNFIFSFVLLLGFWIWTVIQGQNLVDMMFLLGRVGAIGFRAQSQINTALISVSAMNDFSGSLKVLSDLFMIAPEIKKLRVEEKITTVEMSDASYSYGDRTVIDNMSLRAKLGEPVVLRGPSGAGKTTVANLIAGVYQPISGEIIYHGVSGEKYDSSAYRPRVGYVTQDIQLFYGSIRDNLAMGLTIDDDILWNCLSLAGADEFVREMGGLGAEIAEAGRSLSGGEKRRLGIARVLVDDPDILILDEVTSGLDEKRKIEVNSTIRALSKNLVLIVITHDSEMFDSDNIVVISGE
ncbi:MAG: ATP-binding cassette domain-containing protein [Acidobacteriota bacterium]